MDTFVQCSWNIAHTLPCNIAMATFVQRFENIAHTLPCNIVMAPFVQSKRSVIIAVKFRNNVSEISPAMLHKGEHSYLLVTFRGHSVQYFCNVPATKCAVGVVYARQVQNTSKKK